MTLPAEYAWLAREKGPRILMEALKTYGTKEKLGPDNNPEILRWAEVVGLRKVYTADSIPWCGLAVAYWATMAEYEPPKDPLWALNWQKFGTKAEAAMLGDVLVFKRKTPTGWAGHVGLYVGQATLNRVLHYAVLGGNQDDAVNVRFLPATRLVAKRRSPWKIAQPPSVRVVRLAGSGRISTSEA